MHKQVSKNWLASRLVMFCMQGMILNNSNGMTLDQRIGITSDHSIKMTLDHRIGLTLDKWNWNLL